MMLRNAFNELVEVLDETANLSEDERDSGDSGYGTYVLTAEIETLRPR